MQPVAEDPFHFNLSRICMEIHTNTKCGIYEIRHIASNVAYVGATVRLPQRRQRHFYDMSHGYHKNRLIQAAYNASPEGNTAFAFTVLEYCEPDRLKEIEKGYIATGDYVLNIEGVEGNRVPRKTERKPRKSTYRKKGTKRGPKPIGSYHTPFGVFLSAKEAGDASNGIVPAITVSVNCKKPDATVSKRAFSLSRYLQSLGESCIGKTYRELGFWFESK